MTPEELFEKYVHFYHLEDNYVILKEDEKGTYIEYAYKQGAPHDNRCLSWYFSLQPNAIRRNNEAFGHPEETEKEIEWRKKCIKNAIGKIYYLSSFTCCHEEDLEGSLKRNKESWEKYHLGEFIPEDHICRVGSPAPICKIAGHCAHWTYEEPVKCACWHLDEINCKFSIPSKDIVEFSKFINKE
jgi:hypothetical protein